MKRVRNQRRPAFWIGLLAIVAAVPCVEAQQVNARWPASLHGEKLLYRLLWPSGISLGEAVFQASSAGDQLHFRLDIEVQLPHLNLRDSFRSIATERGFCSIQFHQEIKEGTRSWEETIEFDRQNREARRTRDGQTFTAAVPECARDPLTFFYFLRSQLAAGKVPET
ncbi:MAG: DUF3108 domain-containing protein, partial [Acidobacteria bacterium]|nr:DUF3108 domain-containing protein [Acidobacteriota bacterium]